MSEALTHMQMEAMANQIRQDIIRMLEKAGSGHSAGALGLAEVFTALYFSAIKHRPENPSWDGRDRVLVSNGHVNPVLYATLARAGYFPIDELEALRSFGSRLQGHPERTKLPGVETTSGPLGEGLGQGAGMAYVLKRIDPRPNQWVYVVLGDGELDEGSNWEAAMFASHNNLSNLIAIVDRNNIQIDGSTETVMSLEDLRGKWESFGWHVQEIDGNNVESVIDSLSMARAITNQPSVVIAHTIPGRGVDFMEYDYRWHGMAPNSEQAREALTKLRTLKGVLDNE